VIRSDQVLGTGEVQRDAVLAERQVFERM